MASTTDPSLQNLVIYSVFVRNHTPEGTFLSLVPDLPRIRDLGCDVVWLMPVHPIGEVGRKGTLGSPYANRDYRSVNPEYGTLDDFRALVDAIHANGMRCMIDVVYNHTSPDSVLWERHPEFFHRRADGRPGNRIGDWSDVIDLDYDVPGLWDYQVETLRYWAGMVDGFRCDVASLVPQGFWERARAEVEEVRPGCIWLAETVHRSFGAECRRRGMYCARDTEVWDAFDLEYAYDVREAFERYLAGETSLGHYLDLIDFQGCVYPDNHNKLQFLENHDVPRIASLVGDASDLENHTAMLYFLRGATLVYAGQERALGHLPSLFDRDPVDWEDGHDISGLMRRLAQVKHEVLSADDSLVLRADDDNHVAVLTRDDGKVCKLGVFSLRSREAEVVVDGQVPDGSYENLVDGTVVAVRDGRLPCEGRPIILRCPSA